MVMAIFALSISASPSMAENKKPEFVGSERCGTCHKDEYNSWKETFHAKILQPTVGGMLKAAYDKWDQLATDGITKLGPTIGNVTKTPFSRDDVQYVVGSKWKQRFLVKNDLTGNMQFMDKQFNRLTGTWETYAAANDWNTMCATCHTTGYRITEYLDGKTTKSEFSELNIGCEACHGPGHDHVYGSRAEKKNTIFNPDEADIQTQSKVCGYCHSRVQNDGWRSAQGNPREDMPAPMLGETHRAGEDWTTWQGVIIPGITQPFNFSYTDEFGKDLKGMFLSGTITSDGRAIYEEAKHHQQYQGFIQSRHYQEAGMSCLSCHSSHGGKDKVMKDPTACNTCHNDPLKLPTVDRHMPYTGKTANGLYVRSHTFNREPRPSLGPGAPADAPVYYPTPEDAQ